MKEEHAQHYSFIVYVNIIFTVIIINYLAVLWIDSYDLTDRAKDNAAAGFYISLAYFFLKVFWLYVSMSIENFLKHYEFKKRQN